MALVAQRQAHGVEEVQIVGRVHRLLKRVRKQGKEGERRKGTKERSRS
jgi:hypothetical protein